MTVGATCGTQLIIKYGKKLPSYLLIFSIKLPLYGLRRVFSQVAIYNMMNQKGSCVLARILPCV